MTWLMVRPLFDEVTSITFEEAQDVLNYFEEKGVEYIDLAKEEAVRERVEGILKENPDVNLLHYDHGSEDKIWGNDERPIIDLKNVELLAKRECYNNNCSSAAKLGVEAWKREATYWGYTDVFSFTTDALEEFKDFVNHGIKRRVDGLGWKECLQKTKKRATELIDAMVKAGKTLAASCMRWDRDCLVCYNAEKPEPSCRFRRLAIRLFGDVGRKISRKTVLAIMLFWLGFGVALGKLTHTLWEIGGYGEVFAPQGDYLGYALMAIAFILAIREYVELLRKSKRRLTNQSP